MASGEHGHGYDASAVFASPGRNVLGALVFVALVFLFSTIGYVWAGWSFSDAIFMVTITVFSVGYGEVQPIDTHFLHVLTILTIVLGCTGMIFLTGALVQLFAATQLRRLMGFDRMEAQIEKLRNHVIICGFGRIGVQLAKEIGRAHV